VIPPEVIEVAEVRMLMSAPGVGPPKPERAPEPPVGGLIVPVVTI
jgi:hypothetical protein